MSKLLDLLIPYVQISKAILVEEDSHNDDAKARIANLERKFQEDADHLVYELLKHVDTSDANTNCRFPCGSDPGFPSRTDPP